MEGWVMWFVLANELFLIFIDLGFSGGTNGKEPAC